MNIIKATLFIFISLCMFSCSVTKEYSPGKKYDKSTLQKDYSLLRNILEKKHPSLYWYSSKDSINKKFDRYYEAIRDSMTEQQFAWKILLPMVNKLQCGHTSVSMSKGYSKWAFNKTFPSFPLYMKVWNDTMVVMLNLNNKDSLVKKGTILTSINGISNIEMIKKMFDYMPKDGNSNSLNYIRLSSNFPYYHRNIFGISKNYQVTYLDSSGNTKMAVIPFYGNMKDSSKKEEIVKKVKAPRQPKEKRIKGYRSLQLDSTGTYAIMNINTFSKGKLRRFFRKSFRELNDRNIKSLVLDIRYNGGGRVGMSTLLSRYISRQPFKVADTLFSVSKRLGPFTKHISGKQLNNVELFFISKKGRDGMYHIRYLEKKLYQPKKKNHYSGNVYVLTAGPTFSASALFCNAIKGQEGITLLGEETGGGWYGNNGIMIPDIILPSTKLRIRLPLFRLVQYNHNVESKGSGVIPDIQIPTSYEALIKGEDKKLNVVKEIIMKSK